MFLDWWESIEFRGMRAVSREVDLKAVTMGKEARIGEGNGDGMPRLGEVS